MQAQTKALLGAVIVIALALSVVSGVTYSWWEDSEDSTITITTGEVSISAVVQSVSDGDSTYSSTESQTVPDVFPIKGIQVGKALPDEISISDLAPDATHQGTRVFTIAYNVTAVSTVQSVYLIDAKQSDGSDDWLTLGLEGANTNLTLKDLTRMGPGTNQGTKQSMLVTLTLTVDLDKANGVSATVSLTNEIHQNIGTSSFAQLKSALTYAAASTKDSYLILNDDITLSDGDSWTSVTTSPNSGHITIDGNGKTIKGLTSPLFDSTGKDSSGITIKDLTLDGSPSTTGSDDKTTMTATGSVEYFGAFIISVADCDSVVLDGCKLTNYAFSDSTAEGARIGGLIGAVSGSRVIGPTGEQTPVYTEVTITDCTVSNCDITAKGSVGGIIAQCANGENSRVTIEGCTVSECKLTSNDTGDYRVGVVAGTVSIGHTSISDITSNDNVLNQNSQNITNLSASGGISLYGRFAPYSVDKDVGVLTIDNVGISLSDTGATLSTDGKKRYSVSSSYTYVENYDALADALKTGGSIVLVSDIETSKKLYIQKSTVLDGNGHTITSSADAAIVIAQANDADGSSGISALEDNADIVIRNLTLVSTLELHTCTADGHTYVDNGSIGIDGAGALKGWSFNFPKSVTVSNVEFDNFTAKQAVFKGAGSITIDHCTFNGNQAYWWAAQDAGDFGVQVRNMYEGAAITITNNTFVGKNGLLSEIAVNQTPRQDNIQPTTGTVVISGNTFTNTYGENSEYPLLGNISIGKSPETAVKQAAAEAFDSVRIVSAQKDTSVIFRAASEFNTLISADGNALKQDISPLMFVLANGAVLEETSKTDSGTTTVTVTLEFGTATYSGAQMGQRNVTTGSGAILGGGYTSTTSASSGE